MSRPSLLKRVIDLEIPEQDLARGRAMRRDVPRRSLAELIPAERSALDILVSQNADRLADLVPLHFARMLTDPFSFFRGSAAVMAADLAASPSSGIAVMCCGDAHISNFGIYAAPDRTLVFDLNDFDEAGFAPAEWDLKRLLTSGIVGGRHAGYGERQIRRFTTKALTDYQSALSNMLDMDVLSRYYLRVEPERHHPPISGDLDRVVRRTVRRARARTSVRVYGRIMEMGPTGIPQLREQPPVLQHVDADVEGDVMRVVEEYAGTLSPDVAVLLSHYRLTDIARRVVGVGSVGTRCYLAILVGPDKAPLVLQVKEAGRSVLEQHGGWTQPPMLSAVVADGGQGARVVAGQRILQASSDVFLGTTRHAGSDYYVRQFHDMKGTIETEGISVGAFGEYTRACAVQLARAHAQSANASVLRGYVGRNDTVASAILQWCQAYAEKSLADFEALQSAARAGEIEVAADPAR